MRPTSRHSRKSSREGKAAATATEEERLGLVKGDSTNLLPIASRDDDGDDEPVGPPGYSDDWDMLRTSSPGFEPERVQNKPAIRRVDTDGSELSPRDPKEFEKGGGGAYL